jgi:hypothetical protein
MDPNKGTSRKQSVRRDVPVCRTGKIAASAAAGCHAMLGGPRASNAHAVADRGWPRRTGHGCSTMTGTDTMEDRGTRASGESGESSRLGALLRPSLRIEPKDGRGCSDGASARSIAPTPTVAQTCGMKCCELGRSLRWKAACRTSRLAISQTPETRRAITPDFRGWPCKSPLLICGPIHFHFIMAPARTLRLFIIPSGSVSGMSVTPPEVTELAPRRDEL